MLFRYTTQDLLLGICGSLMCFGFAAFLDLYIDTLTPKEPIDPEGTYVYIWTT